MARRRTGDPRSPSAKLADEFLAFFSRRVEVARSRLYELIPIPSVPEDEVLDALPAATVALARKAYKAYAELRFPSHRSVSVTVRHQGKLHSMQMTHDVRALEMTLPDQVRIGGEQPACLSELMAAVDARQEMDITLSIGMNFARELLRDHAVHPREVMFYIPGLVTLASLNSVEGVYKPLQKPLKEGPRVPKESMTLSVAARQAIEEFTTLVSKAAVLESNGTYAPRGPFTFQYTSAENSDPIPLFA